MLAGLLACAVAVPAHAASSGGFAFGTATEPVRASGSGGSITARPAVLLQRTLHVGGTMARGTAGIRVLVQRRLKDGSWATAARAVTKAGGHFTATWKTDHIGRFPMRAIEAGGPGLPVTGTAVVTVFRPGVATYFGHGFYGRQTACGQVLSHRTLGVAHRALPCGTIVSLYYKGRTISVPVVDRGPFRKGTTWDLTEATAHALKMRSTSRIGAVRAPAR